MSYANALLFLILKSLNPLNIYKISGSAALNLVVMCRCFVCCGGVNVEGKKGKAIPVRVREGP
jgi:hypothetical protein